MNYDRIQETFRFITPGLYFLALVLLINFGRIQIDEPARESLSSLSAIIVTLLPFVGFVVGVFIECIMTWLERGLYWIGLPRPSLIVLRGESELYKLDENLREAIIGDKRVNSNKVSNEFQQVAKQYVGDNSIVVRFYHHSIMARHILGAQFLASVYLLTIAGEWSWIIFILVVSVLFLLSLFWFHQNCVYMKYLFAEYGKLLLSKRDEH